MDNPQPVELYQKLQVFSFDQPDTQLPFHKRLARDNGWSLTYAQRVIEEYRKFAFLAVVAGHPVSPSDQVDQAWHLHLTDSRSYWQEFCPQVLQMSLHHEPGRGGISERLKLNDWYHRTLESYERFFGQTPPADIWPPAVIRFGRDLRFVRINTEQNWVVPKPALPSLTVRLNQAILLPLGFTLTVTVAGCEAIAGLPNPLNVTGPDFLIFYSVAAAIAIGLAFYLRARLRLPDGDPVQRPVQLDAYETAYLASGASRVVDTAITRLVQEKHVTVDRWTRSLILSGSAAQVSDPVEQAVVAAIASDGRIEKVRVRTVGVEAVTVIRDRLRQLDLLLSRRQALKAQLYPALLIVALLGLGLAKIFVGVSRGKPVGYLVVLCFLTAIVGVLFAVIAAHRSRYGDRVLETIRSRTRLHHSRQYHELDPQLPLAFALFGTTILADGILIDLKQVFTPPSSGGGGGGDGGGGCGGGCGGCGGG
ncbi:MAG: TIGR04222 domain-containing membrane protein [Leptolyngbyaceae cyanobacterium RU_5_1]|nr:TIGR04222 domain-containing membrane protein [Leptolyngbyaceae cyanobacterium RU_5_1]